MPDRKCLTCKHYEPSPIRHMGWCRNPVLFSPQQSHLVDQESLDCGRRYGNFWESAAAPAYRDDRADADAAVTERKRLRFFEPRERLIPAAAAATANPSSGAGLIARSPGGGDDGDDMGRAPSRGGAGAPGGLPPNQPRPRPSRTGLPQGQERTVSYQPEERYWTDYLRIALPIVGLLLMLGLFWYWASSVIGDDDDEPQATATAEMALITVTAPIPTETPQVAVDANPVTATVAGDAGQTAGGEQTPAADDTTGNAEPTGEVEVLGKGFQPGQTVVTNDGVNMRSEPSRESDVVEELAVGTELEVTGVAVEGGDFFWIAVSNPASGEEGYVADEFVDASE